MVAGGTLVPLSASELAALDPRARVVAIAVGELDSDDWQHYQTEAAPVYPFGVRKSWCGIFALWCLRQAGLTEWLWKDRDGFVFRLGWRVTSSPQPGDIGVKHEPYAHHWVVERVDFVAGIIHAIAGNGEGGEVVRQQYSLGSREIDVYTIQRLVDAATEPGASNSPPDPRRIMRLGDEGPDVTGWQAFLQGQIVGGRFDAYTVACTRVYQQGRGLVPDGVVGPLTRKAAGL